MPEDDDAPRDEEQQDDEERRVSRWLADVKAAVEIASMLVKIAARLLGM